VQRDILFGLTYACGGDARGATSTLVLSDEGQWLVGAARGQIPFHGVGVDALGALHRCRGHRGAWSIRFHQESCTAFAGGNITGVHRDHASGEQNERAG